MTTPALQTPTKLVLLQARLVILANPGKWSLRNVGPTPDTVQSKPLVETIVLKSGKPHEYQTVSAETMQRFVLHAIATIQPRRSGVTAVQLVVFVEMTIDPKSPTATYNPLP